MISVSGIERSPACASWLLNALLIALSELTAPASPTKKPGCDLPTRVVAAV